MFQPQKYWEHSRSQRVPLLVHVYRGDLLANQLFQRDNPNGGRLYTPMPQFQPAVLVWATILRLVPKDDQDPPTGD
jgi:hypothetical protein